MDTKLISTGEDYRDDWATWIFVTCTVLLIAEVVELLWHAYRDATDRGRRPLLRKRAICLFLCLAFVSLFVVNAVKLGYQRSKLAVWGEIEARYRLFEDVGNFTRIRGIVRSRLRNSSLRRLKSLCVFHLSFTIGREMTYMLQVRRRSISIQTRFGSAPSRESRNGWT